MSYTLTGGITDDPDTCRLLVDIDVEMAYTDGTEEGVTNFPVPNNVSLQRFVGECTSRVEGAAAGDLNQYLTVANVEAHSIVWHSIQKHQGSTTGYFWFNRPILAETGTGEDIVFSSGAFMTVGATMKVRLRGVIEYYRL